VQQSIAYGASSLEIWPGFGGFLSQTPAFVANLASYYPSSGANCP